MPSSKVGEINVNDLTQFLYCQRKIYFIKVVELRILKPLSDS
ncbi:MAG: hypothetical protein NZ895_03650 [Archaeoglobaceae archaeon]|nr:hypothetical protein [Archaeoglobaceae archaeon]MDW8013744.1 hypothetical protein [Archaeoglobaceae archaeon]